MSRSRTWLGALLALAVAVALGFSLAGVGAMADEGETDEPPAVEAVVAEEAAFEDGEAAQAPADEEAPVVEDATIAATDGETPVPAEEEAPAPVAEEAPAAAENEAPAPSDEEAPTPAVEEDRVAAQDETPAESEMTAELVEETLTAEPLMMLGAPLAPLGDPAPTTYLVWVGSTQITSANKDDILGDGTATFDPETNTLTFTGTPPNIAGTHASGALIYSDDIDLTIDAPSGLTLNNANICINVNSVSINGIVNLTSSDNAAIYSRAGNVNINGDATIVSKGFCIDAEGSVSIDGNADLTSSNGMAVCSRGESGTKITGNLTARANHMHVIDAYKGDVQIGGNANLDNTYSDGFGIFAGEGNVSIGGDATIMSKNACINAGAGIDIGGNADLTSSKGFALYSTGVAGITIAGNVTASANHVHGILAANGDIQIDGNASVNNSNSSGHGITASEGKVIMTSGRWDITSGAYEAIFAGSGIEIPGTHEITTPIGGKIAQVGGVYTITESDGTTIASHAVIEPKAEKYPVWVGGVQVTSANKDDILGDGTASYTPGEGSGTLTLNGLNVGDGGHDRKASIYAEDIDLTVTGSATLTGSGCGIFVSESEAGGNLTLDDATITYAVPTGEIGICAHRSITVNGGKIDVLAGKEGMNSIGAITILGGTVTAAGTGSGSTGIHTTGHLTISGGTVTATGTSNGMFAFGSMTISGGTITSTGEGNGIRSQRDLTISGGTVVATGTGYGISATRPLKIENGITKVTADGKQAAMISAGGSGAISLGDELIIEEPADGKLSGDGKVIQNADDSTATHAVIVPGKPAEEKLPVHVNVTTWDADGNLITEVGGTATTDKTEVARGESVTVTATPNEGYELETIEFGDGVTGGYQQGKETSSTVPDDFKPVTEDQALVIDVVFKAIAPATEPDEIVYTVVSGGDSTWTKGGTDDVTIVVKRNVDDDTCFSHFTGVEIDGVALASGTDYTAVAGSTVVTLKASALEQQSVGAKTVAVNFDDGKAQTGLTIKENVPAEDEPSDPDSPTPGNDDGGKEAPVPSTDGNPSADPDANVPASGPATDPGASNGKAGNGTNAPANTAGKPGIAASQATTIAKTADEGSPAPWIAGMGMTCLGLAVLALTVRNRRQASSK